MVDLKIELKSLFTQQQNQFLEHRTRTTARTVTGTTTTDKPVIGTTATIKTTEKMLLD